MTVEICPYCTTDSDGYVLPLEKNCHAFIRFGMNGWEIDISAKGWHGSAKIRYCPMCGRKLMKEGDKMAEYHVGCGFTGIFAGTLNKKGDMWRTKSEVTAEVLGSAAQHLLFNKTEFRFECNGEHYVLKVERGQDNGSDRH